MSILNCGPGPFDPGPPEGPTMGLFHPEGPTLSTKIQLGAKTYVHSYSKTYEDALADYFTENTMSWISGKSILYQGHNPLDIFGLIKLNPEDVWKYDVSGESEYGLIEPPINEPNYDLFDSNWSAQFVVFSRDTKFACESLELDWCSHTKGLIPRGITNPYQNCPAQNKIPSFVKGVSGASGASGSTNPSSTVDGVSGSTGGSVDDIYGNTLAAEPSYLELYTAYKEMNECALIEQEIGKEYLGCIWSDPKHPCSCACPEQNDKFADYLAYTRTFATFWETPHYAPLYRIAQIGQLKSSTIIITITGNNDTDIKLGKQIYIDSTIELGVRDNRRNGGVWLITGIRYEFTAASSFKMHLTLMRDVLHHDYTTFATTGNADGITKKSRSVSTPAGHQVA